MSEHERVTLEDPPKRTLVRPLGIAVSRLSDDEVRVTLAVSPFEWLVIELDEGARRILVEQLTGGIVPAISMPGQ